MYGVSVFNDLHILPQVCQCLRFKPISHHDPNESLEFIQKRSFLLSKLSDSRSSKIDPQLSLNFHIWVSAYSRIGGGEFKQTTELFHRILCNTTDGVFLNPFLIPQKNQFFMTKIGKWIIDASPCRLWVFAKFYETILSFI